MSLQLQLRITEEHSDKMALSKEQIKELKSQLSQQIQHLLPEKRKEAQAQIDSMSDAAIETMLKQQQATEVYRMIVSKEIESVIVEENSEALAVLEINPISKGHTIIIPKKPVKDKKKIPESIGKFASKITEKLKSSLNPRDVKQFAELKFGEVIIDLVPEYDSPVSLQSERKKADKKELNEVLKKINIIKIKKKVEKIKMEKHSQEEIIKLKRRIP